MRSQAETLSPGAAVADLAYALSLLHASMHNKSHTTPNGEAAKRDGQILPTRAPSLARLCPHRGTPLVVASVRAHAAPHERMPAKALAISAPARVLLLQHARCEISILPGLELLDCGIQRFDLALHLALLGSILRLPPNRRQRAAREDEKRMGVDRKKMGERVNGGWGVGGRENEARMRGRALSLLRLVPATLLVNAALSR